MRGSEASTRGRTRLLGFRRPQCPLWVTSGRQITDARVSALRPKSGHAQRRHQCLLSAKNRHSVQTIITRGDSVVLF